MKAPKYQIENSYSYYAMSKWNPVTTDYEVETPMAQSEKQFQTLFAKGQKHLFNEEYSLALDSFTEIKLLILKSVHPQLPTNPNEINSLPITEDIALLTPLIEKAGKILADTPVPTYNCPKTIMNEDVKLSAALQNQLKPLTNTGFRVTSFHNKVDVLLGSALEATEKNNWNGALNKYNVALKLVPATDNALHASLLHDMAVINEKLNKKTNAVTLNKQSIALFKKTKDYDAQVHAMKTLTGIYLRSDKKTEATKTTNETTALVKKHNLHPIISGTKIRTRSLTETNGTRDTRPIPNPTLLPSAISLAGGTLLATKEVPEYSPTLMAKDYLADNPAQVSKSITIQGTNKAEVISLAGNPTVNVKSFYNKLVTTDDIGILQGYAQTKIKMVAYVPHLYFFILPMAIGDCYRGLGDLTKTLDSYNSVLKYPYINKKIEIIKVWTSIASTNLEKADIEYKEAKDKKNLYTDAKKIYELILRTNDTININSPLYKDSKFASIKTRVQNFINSLSTSNASSYDDNPQILTLVLEAKTKLFQIKEGLNYFGFDPNYAPPFSFEYLQTTARYFATHASQIESKYIQFKSTAENEELKHEQLKQQVAIASHTVNLESRGVAEAQAGIDVSQANVNYCQTQINNANKAKNEFNDVRWELQELSQLEAWANASSVDSSDQVKLTINWTYYQSDSKKRNEVIQDLASKRTKITHDLQASKLNRTVTSANSYKKVADAQLKQSEARKNIAEKRVEIASLQLKYAQENEKFLDLKQFGASLWYDMAKAMKRITEKYVEMATEISMLMEKAYNAETERGLEVIKYDYSTPVMQGLLGADQLLMDVDYFTYDFITNIQSKKAPVKKTISIGDQFPTALQKLVATGKCQFNTELNDFDRDYPGMYLCKIKNVELVIVGITKATSIAGSLRNVGVSRFRSKDGTINSRLYPADIMPLSQYDIRQDALAFRFDPKDLKIFENNGIETLWELRMGKDANDFNFDEILDIQLVIYYDGFFNPELEQSISTGLPTTGSASRGFSLKLFFPDELFYLKNNGEAILEFSEDMFPYNQTNLKRKLTSLQLSGKLSTINGLKMRLSSEVLGSELVIAANNKGKVVSSSFTQLQNKSMLDKWTLKITAADNPGLVKDGELDLSGLNDLAFISEYDFKYRS